MDVKITAADKRAFTRACAILRRLADKGIGLYLANDTLNLMKGPSHDDGFRPVARQDNVVMSFTIPRMGGGDW